MSMAGTAGAVLFGRRDLVSAELLRGLSQLVEGESREFALEWVPGCAEGEEAVITAAWFELEGAGAWVVSQDVRRARKLAMRSSEVLSCSLDYFEAKFELDRTSHEHSSYVESFECVARRLSSRGRHDTEVHDGNTVLIALDGARLKGARLVRGSEMHLYPVAVGVSRGTDRDSAEPVTELRPNLRDLFMDLASRVGRLRRTGRNAYVLDIDAGAGAASWPKTVYLNAAEVAFISNEIQRRGLLPLKAPALDSSYRNELLRSVALPSR